MIIEVEKGNNAVIERKIYFNKKYPECKEHGSMIKVTDSVDDNFSIWRCPICHIGCIYDNKTEDINPAFFEPKSQRKNRNIELEKEYFKLESFFSKNKIGYKVTGLLSLYLQGFDIKIDQGTILINSENINKLLEKKEIKELKKIKIKITEEKLKRFSVDTIQEIKEKAKNNKPFLEELETFQEQDPAIKTQILNKVK